MYNVRTGIVKLQENVRITRGKTQLNGNEAEVNLNTGISRLIGGKGHGSRPDPPEQSNTLIGQNFGRNRITIKDSDISMAQENEPHIGPAELGDRPHLIAGTPGLSARNLGKQYRKRPVLRNVSLDVQRGEVVGLLGPNGAGKTTCFYIITGLIAADYGEIVLDGQDVTNLPMYRRSRLGVGYLPQEPSIFKGSPSTRIFERCWK